METENLALDPNVLGPGVRAVLTGQQTGQYYVGVTDGEVVAQLMITFEWSDWRNAQVWWIQSVYVHPDHRRKGWYRRLYDFVHQAAQDAGAAGIRLYVDRTNTAAQSVYARLGMNGDHYQLYESMFT